MESIEAQTAENLPGRSALVLPIERTLGPAKRRVRLRDLGDHRHLIGVVAIRDFKVKFKQSLIGPLWIVIQPVALLAALAIGFGGVVDIGSPVPYALFVLVALSAWMYFLIAFNMGALSLVTNYTVVQRTPCPRIVLPLASLLTNLPALAVPAAAALIYAGAVGHLSARVVLLPVGIAWVLAVTGAAVLLVAGLAARYRDVIQAVPFVLQLGVFAAPIGYSLDHLGPAAQKLVALNPLTGVIEFWRWLVLTPYDLPGDVVLISLATSAILLVISWRAFTRFEVTMADFI